MVELKIGDKFIIWFILFDSFYFIDLYVLGFCGCVLGERGLNFINLF